MSGWLRTLLFRLVFYGGSVPIILAVPVTALFGRAAMIRHARFWSRYQRRCARWLLGITVRVEGPRPAGPVLYAVKHQSFFEAIDMADALDGPAIILKRELTRIPLWGYATRVYGAIAVDREASAAMLRRMMTQGRALTGAGRSILLFPEGTRVPPGEAPPLKSGFAGLYKTLKLPVVPVAVDSGRLWPKRGSKRPGVITYRFGEPVPPGLPREEAEARVHAAINSFEPLTLRTVASSDQTKRWVLVRQANGFFAYSEHTLEEILEEDGGPGRWWQCTHQSGLFDSVGLAERDAIGTLPWLRGTDQA